MSIAVPSRDFYLEISKSVAINATTPYNFFMGFKLVLWFCTIVPSLPKPIPCAPTVVEYSTSDECEMRAKYFDTEFSIKRTYKGQTAVNEPALIKKPRCERSGK